jgi:predicted SnoaL-like aldol condensation-catalyzing enzyme
MNKKLTHKEAAVLFLTLVTSNKIDEAYKEVGLGFIHHNPFYKSDAQSLKTGMKENETQFPHKEFEIKHVFEDHNFVSVHSHVILDKGKLEFATVHVFRFEKGAIVEMWDIAQQIPAAIVNEKGMF